MPDKIDKIIDGSINALYNAILVDKTVSQPNTLIAVIECLLKVKADDLAQSTKEEMQRFMGFAVDRLNAKISETDTFFKTDTGTVKETGESL